MVRAVVLIIENYWRRHAALAPFVLTGGLQAQPLPSEYPNVTFFVSSVGGPKGADFGGLTGADKHCQDLAAKIGAGSKTWHAYLSVQATGGATAVNARDRIGRGPWVNVNGVQIAALVLRRRSGVRSIGPHDST
jgi:hypothetical protein